MKRLLALGLLVILLAGCGGAKPSAPVATEPAATPPATASTPTPAPTPAPATPAPAAPTSAQPTPAPAAPAAAEQPAPAPAPAPVDPVAALKQVCVPPAKQGSPGPSLSALLVPVLQGVAPDQVQQRLDALRKELGMCVDYAVSKPGEPPLVVAGSLVTPAGAVLWRNGDSWVGQDVPGLTEQESILLQRQDAQGREVYLRSGSMGTGVFGSFVVLRLASGTWQTLFASPVYEKMGVKALSENWVVVTGRKLANDIPLINSANCCMPIDYQWLYQRQGDRFKLAAERRAPDPAFTINVFMGAVRDNNTVWLSQLGSTQAVETARRLNLAQLQVAWADNPQPKPGDPDVRSMEFAHWDALPPELNGPVPTVTTLSYKAKVPNATTTAIMTMKRLDDRWFIESITEQ